MQLDRYRILEKIGGGAMGVVYRAHSADLGRDVALKVLLDGAHANERQRRRFKREAEAMAKLEHPNIVRVRDMGESDSGPYLVMDLVEGETLDARLERGPLSNGLAAEVVRDLALALDCAHAQGILHRDIKPANVILTPDARPMLTDFGLAKDTELDRSKLTQSGAFLGTPGFWPPEQAIGDGDRIGPASDVYSLGATLYAALTLEPPIQADTAAGLIGATLHKEPASLAELNPKVDPTLELICLRCLAKEPAHRYQSGAELAEELTRYLAGGSVDGPRRAGLRALATAVSVALAAALLAAAFLGRPGAPAPTPPLAAPRETAPAEPDDPVAPARALVAQGRHREALSSLAPVLAAQPDSVDALLERGVARVFSGDVEGGMKDLARVLTARPAEARALRTQGVVYADSGDPIRAILAFNRSLRSDRTAGQTYIERGTARHRLGDIVGALEDFRQATVLRPLEPTGHFNRGSAHYVLGEFAAAVASLSRCLELDPTLGAAHNNLGLAHRALGDNTAALEDFSAAIRLNAQHANAYTNRGMVRLDTGDLRGAIDDLNEALKLTPRDPEVWINRASAWGAAGEFERALEDYRQTLDLVPANSPLAARAREGIEKARSDQARQQ